MSGETMSSETKKKYNFDYIGTFGDDMYSTYDEYVCYNQRGFNNALYNFYGLDLEKPDAGIINYQKRDKWNIPVFRQGKNGEKVPVYNGQYSEKAEIRNSVQCWPTEYPATIRIYRYHTFESGRLYMDILTKHKGWTYEITYE